MAAIVTEQFRRNSAKTLLSEIADNSKNFYVGLGKSDTWVDDEAETGWTVPDPSGTNGEALEIKSNLTSLLRAEIVNSKLVVPRINYKAGARYKAYSPYDENCFYPETVAGNNYLPCYVVNSTGPTIAIYLCLYAPPVPSSAMPDDISGWAPRSYGTDGYVWLRIDTFAEVNSPINTDQYISISSGTVASNVASSIATASGGILYGFNIVSGGSDYIGSMTVTFNAYKANGTTQAIVCTPVLDSEGAITALYLPNNYDYATTGFVGGTISIAGAPDGQGAVIAPHIAPLNGLAYEPSNVLPSWFVGIAVKATNDISSDGFYIPYRQISILKNVQHNQSGNPPTLGALKYIRLTAALPNLSDVSPGTVITFANGSKALFDSYAEIDVEGTTQYRVYYHQNTKSEYGKIIDSSSLSIAAFNNVAYTSTQNNEYVPNSGEVIFVENRKPIIRAQGQTEEIKIIIQM